MVENEFVKLRALRAFVPYASSRLRAFGPYAPSCLPCLRALCALIFTSLICYLRALLTRDIKSIIKNNFKMI